MSTVNDNTTAPQRWGDLDGKRESFIRRCETYAAYTLPKICLPQGYGQNNDSLMHDYQSLGAQAVNHLANKLMLALFAPSRPFFRLGANDKMKKTVGDLPPEAAAALSKAEHDAAELLDKRSLRPKLYDTVKNIIVTGNVLLILEKSNIRTLGLKKYCVKRDTNGHVLELITCEETNFMSLSKDIVQELGQKVRGDTNDCVKLYRWIRKEEDGRYHLTTWVDDVRLSVSYESMWTEDKMPYRAITWDLASGDDYGTGLVEDYEGDFGALSIMSKATIQAAILAGEFRWLVNPTGITKPDDFEKSENGAALPGVKGDIELIASGKASDLQVNLNIAQMYINRIGAGFLLQTAVTRQAERVTAEEIRKTAEELESGLGGAYSRIAVDLQVPLAGWLMNESGKKIAGTDLEVMIVTGLAALSRSGDRDNLMLFLQDCAGIGTLPPALLNRLKLGAVQASFAAARGLPIDTYLISEEQYKADEEARMQQQTQLMAAQAGSQAAAQKIAQE